MFSMASMTDVIFLLLIFFMVTSTFVFPSALEINLPQSSQTTSLKPTSRIYIDSIGIMYYTMADSLKETEPQVLPYDSLETVLAAIKATNDSTHQFVALHADEAVPYGSIVDILDKGSKVGLKIVLATQPTSRSYAHEALQAQRETAARQPLAGASAANPNQTQSQPTEGNP